MQAEPAFQAAEVFWMEMLVSTAFFSLLAAVSVRDIWYREVSDRLQAGIVMTACLRVLFLNVSPCYILGGFILVPYLVAALCGKEGKGIGGGDIKLAGCTLYGRANVQMPYFCNFLFLFCLSFLCCPIGRREVEGRAFCPVF